MSPSSLVAVLGPVALACAVAFQFTLAPAEPPAARPAHLASILPESIAGFTSRSMELGPTEAVAEAAEKILRFDEVFYREYRKGGATVSLYVAYWGPGRMPVRLVASHTPDRCWTENGWTCLEVRHAERLEARGERPDPLPAEWRVFDIEGNRQWVYYWHLVDGEPESTGRFNAAPDPVTWLRDYFAGLGKPPEEQYFIRINASVPFEELAGEPGFHDLLAAVAELHAFARTAREGAGS